MIKREQNSKFEVWPTGTQVFTPIGKKEKPADFLFPESYRIDDLKHSAAVESTRFLGANSRHGRGDGVSQTRV
jgi:hypothetical protein